MPNALPIILSFLCLCIYAFPKLIRKFLGLKIENTLHLINYFRIVQRISYIFHESRILLTPRIKCWLCKYIMHIIYIQYKNQNDIVCVLHIMVLIVIKGPTQTLSWESIYRLMLVETWFLVINCENTYTQFNWVKLSIESIISRCMITMFCWMLLGLNQ